ncbi:5-formyltetrahydrofolate cyclo-ligase [Streptomyces capparidis]
MSKTVFRKRLLKARLGLTADERGEAEAAVTAHALALPELAGAAVVAAYVSVGSEPGTRELLEALRARGTRVLLPVLLPDGDLDWAEYTGPEGLRRVSRTGGTSLGLLEPGGPRLGVDAVTGADAVLLPGLAVDVGGMRLGRGGGSYDRVLERLGRARGDVPLVVLLHRGEIVPRVPAEPHDRRVTAAVTPEGVRRF